MFLLSSIEVNRPPITDSSAKTALWAWIESKMYGRLKTMKSLLKPSITGPPMYIISTVPLDKFWTT